MFTAGTATCGAGTDQTLACDTTAINAECSNVSGSIAPERVAVLQNLCTLYRGTPEASCTTADLVATCTWRAPPYRRRLDGLILERCRDHT